MSTAGPLVVRGSIVPDPLQTPKSFASRTGPEVMSACCPNLQRGGTTAARDDFQRARQIAGDKNVKTRHNATLVTWIEGVCAYLRSTELHGLMMPDHPLSLDPA